MGRLLQRRSQFQDRGERWLLLAEFEDADVGSPQISLETKLLLREAGFLAKPA